MGIGYFASDYNIYQDPDGVFHILPHDMNEAFRPTRGGRGPGGPGFGRGGLVSVEVVVPVLALKVPAFVLKVLKVLALAQMVLAFVQMAGGRVVPILVVNVPVLRHPKGVMRRVGKKARWSARPDRGGPDRVDRIAVDQIAVGQQRLLLTMGATILIRLSGLTM